MAYQDDVRSFHFLRAASENVLGRKLRVILIRYACFSVCCRDGATPPRDRVTVLFRSTKRFLCHLMNIVRQGPLCRAKWIVSRLSPLNLCRQALPFSRRLQRLLRGTIRVNVVRVVLHLYHGYQRTWAGSGRYPRRHFVFGIRTGWE